MDENYADIYYIDERNAITTNDHRTGGSPTSGIGGVVRSVRPAVRVQTAPQPRTVYLGSPQRVPQQVVIGEQYPNQSTAGRLLGQLTTGQVLEMATQGYAAIQSLPAPPVPTKDPATDVANLIMYQAELAEHAKNDEKVRTLGALIARLVS